MWNRLYLGYNPRRDPELGDAAFCANHDLVFSDLHKKRLLQVPGPVWDCTPDKACSIFEAEAIGVGCLLGDGAILCRLLAFEQNQIRNACKIRYIV